MKASAGKNIRPHQGYSYVQCLPGVIIERIFGAFRKGSDLLPRNMSATGLPLLAHINDHPHPSPTSWCLSLEELTLHTMPPGKGDLDAARARISTAIEQDRALAGSLCRLAIHDSLTYDENTRTGMFSRRGSHFADLTWRPATAGLHYLWVTVSLRLHVHGLPLLVQVLSLALQAAAMAAFAHHRSWSTAAMRVSRLQWPPLSVCSSSCRSSRTLVRAHARRIAERSRVVLAIC